MAGHWNLLRGKTARRYVLSYIIIGIIPIIFMSILLYTQSWMTLSQRHESRMLSQIEQMKGEMDGYIAAMHADSIHFAGIVSSLEEETAVQDARGYRADTLLREQLTLYAEQFQFPCEVLYYPNYSQTVYTTSGAKSYYDFWREHEHRHELDMSQFYSNLNVVTQPEWIMSRTTPSSADGNMLLYFSPIPPLDANSSGTLAFLFRKEHFNSMATQYCGDFSGYFIAFNPYYDITYSLNRYGADDMGEISRVYAPLKGTGVVRHSAMGEAFVTARAVSHTTGFTYLYSVPADSINALILSQTNLYLWLIGALLLICLLLAVLLTARSIRPIRRLADAFLPADLEETEDMFEQLHSHYEHVMTEQNALLLRTSRQEARLRAEIMEDLLHGRFAGEEALAAALRQADMALERGYGFVIALRVDASGVKRTLEALARLQIAGCSCQAAEIEKGTVALILSGTAPPNRADIARRVGECLASPSDAAPALGVGTVYTELLRMDMSYCEALAAIREGETFFNENEQAGGDYLCPAPQGAMLRQVLLRGSADMAAQVLRHMADNVQNSLASFSQTRVFCFFITGILMQTRTSLGAEYDYDDLIRSATHSELPLFLDTAEAEIRRVCALVHENGVKMEQKRVADIIAYIKEHFTMYNISAETVAVHFNLSESHLRRVFKEHTGQAISSYISTLRLERIKQQLAETDAAIKDIIINAGYADVSSFTRKFKLAEGTTPGQYRAMHRKG